MSSSVIAPVLLSQSPTTSGGATTSLEPHPPSVTASASKIIMTVGDDDPSMNYYYSCSQCHTSKYIFTDWIRGDTLCRNCGLVLEESVRDETPEWNMYQDDIETGTTAKQRTAGPVRPDGTLEPTTLSTMCFGGTTNDNKNNCNTNLRQRLVRIQHVRDHIIAQQQTQLVQNVTMDLAIKKRKLAEWISRQKQKKKKKKQKATSNSSSIKTDEQQQYDDDEYDEEDEDDEEDDSYFNTGSSTIPTTTDVPPPRNMILIEEHLEAQIEQEQAQWDEKKRLLNIEKWTLQRDDNTTLDDDDDDKDDGNGQHHQKKKRRRKRTKKESAEFERARETLAKATEIFRSLARKQQSTNSLTFSETMIDTTLQRFQWYGATNDKLPMAACAAIVHITCGKSYLDAYGTTKVAVKKITKQILAQFPNWNTTIAGGTVTTTDPAAATTTTTTTTTTAVTTKDTVIMALLDRLKQTTSSNNNNTTLRNAILPLRDSLTTPATILAAVYFCSMVQYKLSQLGLTTKTSSGGISVPPPSVAQLAKQGNIPASRIKAAYQSANRNLWLEQVATVLPQAVMVGKVLPNKAV